MSMGACCYWSGIRPRCLGAINGRKPAFRRVAAQRVATWSSFNDVMRSREHHIDRAGTWARRLGIVHVLSHSRHRQYVVTVRIVACVSTALPWQKGHMAGRVPPSSEREPGIVMVFSTVRVERASSTACQSRSRPPASFPLVGRPQVCRPATASNRSIASRKRR